jgi:hypothetical protein
MSNDSRLSVAMREVHGLWRSGRAELDEAIVLVTMGDSTGQRAQHLRNALQARASFDAAIHEQEQREEQALKSAVPPSPEVGQP